MIKPLSIKLDFFFWLIPLIIISALVLIAKSPVFYQFPDKLSVAITLDFLVTLPLAFYPLIRRKNISWIAVTPVATLGIILAGLVLPKDHQEFLAQARMVSFSLMELMVIAFLIIKAGKAKKAYNLQKDAAYDFYTALKNAVSEVMPKGLSNLLSTEIAVFYYALFCWSKRKLESNEFTCYKENGTIAILFVIIFMIIVETVVQHILIGLFSAAIAWIITIVSIYSVFVLFGISRSLSWRPVLLTDNKIHLRYGIISEAIIHFDIIESVQIPTPAVKTNKELIFLSPLHKLENKNVVINLLKEGILHGFYGRKKKFKSIGFYVDDLARFKDVLGRQMDSCIVS